MENQFLKIAGTSFTYLNSGAYGFVFADRQRGRIRKVYRKLHDRSSAHSRDVFEAEAAAYEIAMNVAELRELVPDNFERLAPQKIEDQQGRDLTNEFYPDLAFETDIVEGPLIKLGTLTGAEPERVRLLFATRGVHHIRDADVRLDGTRIAKLVDFATHEIELWHGEYL